MPQQIRNSSTTRSSYCSSNLFSSRSLLLTGTSEFGRHWATEESQRRQLGPPRRGLQPAWVVAPFPIVQTWSQGLSVKWVLSAPPQGLARPNSPPEPLPRNDLPCPTLLQQISAIPCRIL